MPATRNFYRKWERKGQLYLQSGRVEISQVSGLGEFNPNKIDCNQHEQKKTANNLPKEVTSRDSKGVTETDGKRRNVAYRYKWQETVESRVRPHSGIRRYLQEYTEVMF